MFSKIYGYLWTGSYFNKLLTWNITFFQGELTEDTIEYVSEEDKKIKEVESTKFRLVGILVHSGQASGGHYYSYVLQRY